MRSRAGTHAKLRVRNRVSVRVVGRVSELCVDLRLELFRQRVLEPVGLGMDLVERKPEPVREKPLEEAVVPEHLERATAPPSVSATPRYGARSTRPSSSRRFVMAVADGALTRMREASADVVTRSPADSRA